MSLLITAIQADRPPLHLPAWLGKQPPAAGDWDRTLSEDFDGSSIDLHRWNVHSDNWWDKRNHFSKDEVIVKDGFLTLRTEKKTGFHNDNSTGAKSEFATGWADSAGKWSQRYGYFEVRERQPAAPDMWPGFWMMPNQGGTEGNGMEFDVTESQSSWGIHRFNIAAHWDGYSDSHKSLGTSSNYVQADAQGFIVVGLLWTPGSVVFYGNGEEFARWESPRISSVSSTLIFQNLIGGWDNAELNEAQLPADFVVDYIRVWQRKDLASPGDGPHPNQGGPKAPPRN